VEISYPRLPGAVASPFIKLREVWPTSEGFQEAARDAASAPDLPAPWGGVLQAIIMESAFWPTKPRGLRRWVAHEFACGRPQAWLAEHGLDEEAATYLASRLAGAFAMHKDRHRPLPHYQRSTWADLMTWASAVIKQEEALAATWDERLVVFAFDSGWSVEAVRTPADLDREGELMGNCMSAEEAADGVAIFSLRDPDARPHADIAVRNDGVVIKVEGRFSRPAKPRYLAMVEAFARACGLQLDWRSLPEPESWQTHAEVAHPESVLGLV